MPKEVEDCVKSIRGVNKRTGKPYTDSEKWAICKARHEGKGKSEIQIFEEVANATYNYANYSFKSGDSSSMTEAYEKAQVALTKANYNYEVLELIVGK